MGLADVVDFFAIELNVLWNCVAVVVVVIVAANFEIDGFAPPKLKFSVENWS